MFSQQLLFLIPFSLMIFGFALFLAYMIINTKGKFLVKFIGVPLLITIALLSYKFFDETLGYAYPTDNLPHKFVFMGFTTFTTEKERVIELWLRSESDKTRLYRVPYSEKLLEELMAAEEEVMNGKTVMGEFARRKTDADLTMAFKFYNFEFNKQVPKEDPAAPITRPVN